MRAARALATLVIASVLVTTGLAGVAAADEGVQTGVDVSATADSTGTGTAFAATQSSSAGFSGHTPIVEVGASGSVGGGSAVSVGLSSAN